MSVKYRKNKIKIKSNDVGIPYIPMVITYLAMATYLSILYPKWITFFLAGLFLLLVAKNYIKQIIEPQSITISHRGIRITGGKFTNKLFKRKDIYKIYIHEIKNEVNFYINNKEHIQFNFKKDRELHLFKNKIKKLLKLKLEHSQKTSTGNISKYVGQSYIDKKKKHIEKATLDNSSSPISKSNFFSISNAKEELKVTSKKSIWLHNSEFTIDQNTNSIRIRLDNNIPQELDIDQIATIKIAVTQNASGEEGDLIEGKLLIVNSNKEVITLFHTKIKEKNPLDFTADQLEQDLIALKATIEFHIYDSIDRELNSLDLDELKSEYEKQKVILPNRNDSDL